MRQALGRGATGVFVVGALVVLLASYVAYTQRVVTELRAEAKRSAQMYATVYRALGSPSEEGAMAALLDLSGSIARSGVPLVLTDPSGRPTAAANLPFDVPREVSLDDPRVRAYVARLDRENAPVAAPGLGVVHYGNTPLVSGLRVIPALQVMTVVVFLLAGVYILVVRGRAEREKLWAGMARESAHQLGTPLTSLTGWTELLEERGGDPVVTSALVHMRGDLERLERVARRFERIGRPARRDPVDLGALAANVAEYFRARVPTLAHAVTISLRLPEQPIVVPADAVLVEWALEALVKNAIDALAGRGGHIELSVARTPSGRARVRVADDGPGVPRELRSRVFEAGFSTKEHGWGVGLSLARRIVEENHGGSLQLVPTERGATFDVILG